MATNTQIKTSIDTNITNKTVAGSIDNTAVGSDIKSVVDYVDQEIATVSSVIKQVKVNLSSAEILALFTTPKILVSPSSGKLLIPKFLFQKYTHVTTPYTGGATWRIGLGSINTAYAVLSAAIGSADNAQAINTINHAWSTSGTSYTDLSIVIGATSANPTLGDGTMELYLTYEEITL